MANIYCGNNLNDPRLTGGAQVLGSRYQCLQKGIGVGRNLPFDPNYLQPYVPIDPTRSYCGNAPALPGGYDRMGKLQECYTKGVGIGRVQRAHGQVQPPPVGPVGHVGPVGGLLTFWSLNLTFLGIFVIIFLLFYFLKPSLIVKENEKNEIDWEKFIPNLLAIALILGIIRYALKIYYYIYI